MELKPYQQQVIEDLSLFLAEIQKGKKIGSAFYDFWSNHARSPLQPFVGSTIEPYKNNIPRVPHVCIKVPTAGGKTFIACNAIKTIFDAFAVEKPKAVVWLVPSITILEQTLKNLKDPNHFYRQRINTHFSNRVAVFQKDELLEGMGFNASSIREQLNIMVFSFDSLRAKKKEDRKVFQENGQLQSFAHLLEKEKDITLGEVIHYLNPLVIVDESHNAESELSVDMLKVLNPSFILDLTATPRKNSNIISFVDSLALKTENMVKLPVIVCNHQDKTEVVFSALELQRNLEQKAIAEEKKGGKYIRPIVLFQAQPKGNDDNTTFQKLKENLVSLDIPESHIKIKTANLNEIKGMDLMSRNCEVRYIITVNALKEGWDCPFAYILASLADKSSAVDVEQILGRVLRQPHIRKHSDGMLNVSYVLTASSKFMNTLQNIVKALNKAGFSPNDYKVAETVDNENITTREEQDSLEILFAPTSYETIPASEEKIEEDIDLVKIKDWQENKAEEVEVENSPLATIGLIEDMVKTQNEAFEEKVAEIESGKVPAIPTELQTQVKTYSIKDTFKTEAERIRLPQFYLKGFESHIFETGEKECLLEKENLLEGFLLSKMDTEIDFENVSSELYKIDLDETRKEHTPSFMKIDGRAKEHIMAYLLNPSRKEQRVKNVTGFAMKIIGNMYPIADKEIEKYVNRILESFTDEQFRDFASKDYSYIQKIKNKIEALSLKYQENKFKTFLDTDKIVMRKEYAFPLVISPKNVGKDLIKSLYEKEESMNGFEEKLINEVANLPNILFWTRNSVNKGFRINGFINHYPDFIVVTKSGKVLVIEPKGDHLNASQKIKLGRFWASKAGNDFRYFMVYDKQIVEGSYTLDAFLSIVKEL